MLEDHEQKMVYFGELKFTPLLESGFDVRYKFQVPLILLLCGNIAALIIVSNYILTLDTAKLAAQDPGHFPVRVLFRGFTLEF